MPKQLTKDEMREYQAKRRLQQKQAELAKKGVIEPKKAVQDVPGLSIPCKSGVNPVQKQEDLQENSVKNVNPSVNPAVALQDLQRKFTGSPVNSLPKNYDRGKYLALLPESIRDEVLRQNAGIVQAGIEDDLDLRIVRAVHYQLSRTDSPAPAARTEPLKTPQGFPAESIADELAPGNKNIFKRLDGSRYILDASGNKTELDAKAKLRCGGYL